MEKSIKKQTTMDDLAIMIGKGFASQDKRFEKLEVSVGKLEGRVDGLEDKMDQRFAHVNARLDTIERDIQSVRDDLISRDEFEDLSGRVKYIEMKLDIETGK